MLSHSVMPNSFVTPRTVACQIPLSMGFSWQEYGNGLPFPPSGDLPNPGTEPTFPASADKILYHQESSSQKRNCLNIKIKLCNSQPPPPS